MLSIACTASPEPTLSNGYQMNVRLLTEKCGEVGKAFRQSFHWHGLWCDRTDIEAVFPIVSHVIHFAS